MRTVEAVIQEITDLNGQDNKAAFEKFLEIAAIGRDSGNKYIHVMGMMNAAAVALRVGTSELCMELMTAAHDVDEEIWTKYLQEQPHMYEMMETLSKAGVFNN
jgi:hypothetical protein